MGRWRRWEARMELGLEAGGVVVVEALEFRLVERWWVWREGGRMGEQTFSGG